MTLYTHIADEDYPQHDLGDALARVIEVDQSEDFSGRWVLVAYGTKHTAQNFKRYAADHWVEVEIYTRRGRPQRNPQKNKSEIWARVKKESSEPQKN